MAARRPTLLFTMGDPAGIGPEILVRTLANPALRREARLAAVGDPEVLGRAARLARVELRLNPLAPERFDPRAENAAGIPLVISTTDAWGGIEPGVPSEAWGALRLGRSNSRRQSR